MAYDETTIEGEYGVPSMTERVAANVLLAILGTILAVLFFIGGPVLKLYSKLENRE